MAADSALSRVISRIGMARRHTRAMLALAAGAAIGAGQAPFGLWLPALAGLALAALLLAAAPRARAAALAGWLVAAGSYLVSMHWIVEPFLVDASRHGWMAPFALILLAAGLALFWGAGFALAHWLARSRAGSVALLPATLGLAELARGYFFTGFPWNMPGYIWLDTPLARLAALVGPYGLSVLSFGLVCWPLALWLGRRRAAALLLPVLACALWFLPVPPEQAPAPDAPRVRLIQPNAPQHLKWDAVMAPVYYGRAIEATAAPGPDGRRPDLIVWPETSVPVLLNHAADALAHIAQNAGGVPVVLGIQRRRDLPDGAAAYHNSAVLLDATGRVTQIYDKHHLVPFGEYLPLSGLMGRLGLRALADLFGGGYAPGPGPRLLDLGALGRALPLICYEAVFPRDVARAPARPDFLLQITNDAWFGTFSGPYQHLAQARMRAIEQGLPLIRAANTGVSAVIDATGVVRASLPLGQSGHLDAALPVARAPTLYAGTGEWPVPVLLLLVLGAALLARRITD